MNNRQILIRIIFLVFFCTIMLSSVFAQHANFSGTWKRTAKEQLSGQGYANSIYDQLKIQQSATQLTIEETTETPGQSPFVVTENLPIHGDVVRISAAGRKRNSFIKWTADKSFTEIKTASQINDETKEDFTTTDNWSLSADGKQLIIVRSFQKTGDANDAWTVKGAFEKQ